MENSYKTLEFAFYFLFAGTVHSNHHHSLRRFNSPLYSVICDLWYRAARGRQHRSFEWSVE